MDGGSVDFVGNKNPLLGVPPQKGETSKTQSRKLKANIRYTPLTKKPKLPA